MNISNRGHDLSEECSGLLFAEAIPVYDVIEEFAARAVFEHHEDLGVVFKDLE